MKKNGNGAEGGIRTLTPCGATPSRWCVCQFRHFRIGDEEIYSVEMILACPGRFDKVWNGGKNYGDPPRGRRQGGQEGEPSAAPTINRNSGR